MKRKQRYQQKSSHYQKNNTANNTLAQSNEITITISNDSSGCLDVDSCLHPPRYSIGSDGSLTVPSRGTVIKMNLAPRTSTTSTSSSSSSSNTYSCHRPSSSSLSFLKRIPKILSRSSGKISHMKRNSRSEDKIRMTNNICCNDNRRNVNDGAASHTLLPNMNGKEIFDRIEDLIDLEVF